MSRYKRFRAIQSIKVLMIWLVAFGVNVAFIVAIRSILPYRPVLKWILIISFTYVWVLQFFDLTEKIMSPRNGHSRRGHR